MRIYVAAKFQEKERTRVWHARLKEAGFTITHDWTVEDDTKFQGKPDELNAYNMRCAKADVEGVVSADAVLLLPHPRGQGMYIEMGIAVARGIPVVVIHDNGKPVSDGEEHFKPGVFFALPSVQIVKDDLGALSALTKLVLVRPHSSSPR